MSSIIFYIADFQHFTKLLYIGCQHTRFATIRGTGAQAINKSGNIIFTFKRCSKFSNILKGSL